MTPHEYIAAELRGFARTFIANRTRDIVARDLRNTEALLRSLYAKVNTDPARGIFFMTVFFNTYGRYQDMRRNVSRVGGEDMEKSLEAWAEREGISKFKRGRYSGVYQRMPDERILNRIAWGIMRKQRGRGRSKVRGWYNRGKTRDIEQFYDELLRGYSEAVLAEMKKHIV